MLDNLKRVESAREVKPDKISPGLQKLLEIERKAASAISAAPQGTPRTPLIDDYVSTEVSKYAPFKEQDLQDYVVLASPKDTSDESYMVGSITANVLWDLFKHKDSVYINGLGQSYSFLFNGNPTGSGNLIVDDIISINFLYNPIGISSVGRLTVANSRLNYIPRISHDKREECGIIIADSIIERSPEYNERHSTGTFVFANSKVDMIDIRPTNGSHCNLILIASDVPHIRMTSDTWIYGSTVSGILVHTFGRYVSKTELSKMHELGLQMKDKDGRHIDILGQRILEIFYGCEKRC